MQRLKAIVLDEGHLKLQKPIDIERGTEVEILVLDARDFLDEQDSWNNFSLSSLASAYSNQEPEYTAKMVKENNPGYTP